MIEKIIKNNTDIFLKITGQVYECASYMPKMLEKNLCSNFLPVRYQDTDEIIYDTVYGQSVNEYIQAKGYTNEFLHLFLCETRNLFKVCASFLLDVEHIVIDTGYIYIYKNDKFGFIFNPYEKRSPVTALKDMVLKFAADNYVPDSIVSVCKDSSAGIDDMISSLVLNEYEGENTVKSHENTAVLKNILDIDDCISIGKKDVSVGKLKVCNDKAIFAHNISLRHALIKYSGNDVYIKDCKSRHGTYINRIRITGSSFVKAEKGDIVAFADHEYIVVS